MSDEDLYAFDILNKVGNDNITDEELDAALEAAKANETLFKKTVDGLRQQYNRLQEEQNRTLQINNRLLLSRDTRHLLMWLTIRLTTLIVLQDNLFNYPIKIRTICLNLC